ncbi:hypothetical protein Glove_450g19 [Diversispora epigaea]|uniref:Uncharacterized protein n=1 Tax=Diversispora epigaea TaxID=1348612 RepID=A0A397GU07_9GLOM|nr:hypothetical protein Glove_450g19 [Diversispora epigaea]
MLQNITKVFDSRDNDELCEDLEKTKDKIIQTEFALCLKNVNVFDNVHPLTYHRNSPKKKQLQKNGFDLALEELYLSIKDISLVPKWQIAYNL